MRLPTALYCMSKHILNYQKSQEFDGVTNHAAYCKKQVAVESLIFVTEKNDPGTIVNRRSLNDTFKLKNQFL